MNINGVELSCFEAQSVRTEIENAIDRWEHYEACSFTETYKKLSRDTIAAFKRVLDAIERKTTECTNAR